LGIGKLLGLYFDLFELFRNLLVRQINDFGNDGYYFRLCFLVKHGHFLRINYGHFLCLNRVSRIVSYFLRYSFGCCGFAVKVFGRLRDFYFTACIIRAFLPAVTRPSAGRCSFRRRSLPLLTSHKVIKASALTLAVLVRPCKIYISFSN
jgi:hypothetical protein